MKLPLSWLREWVDIPWDDAELARRLTMLGLEVESLQPVAPPFSGVVVAEILSAEPHPQADRLRVCRVAAGDAGTLQIVCGAPNARAGLKSPLAQVGAELPGGLKIKAAKLRGVDSQGMLCSAAELGLTASNDGIIELDSDAPVGSDLRRWLDLDDRVIEIGVTPNRGDAMSVLGIAREIAALTGGALKGPAAEEVRAANGERFPVRLQPGAGAGRFASRVIRGVANRRATPRWMRERLQRAGLRTISPVVDVTNYVLLELGQPMHAYDLQRLDEGIDVRRARTGEAVRLLDGREIPLSDDVLTITDEQGIVGLAGIMGGDRTAITADTTDLLFEVAWFAPQAVAGRARRYGLLTDASQRFERGVDPQLQLRAIERATALLLDITGGSPGPVDLQQLPAELPQRSPVRLRLARARQLLGRDLSANEASAALQALGMQPTLSGEQLDVRPPSWRFDIALEVDLIEELARLTGLDQVPETPLLAERRISSGSEQRLPERSLLQLLAARGYQETINFGFVDPKLQQLLLGTTGAVSLRNPISSDLAVMRASLWPGLIRVAQHNLRRQQERLRLFEIATRLEPLSDGQVREQKVIAGLALGSRLPEQWGVSRQALDFYDVKADIEALLDARSARSAAKFEVPASTIPPALHPGRCAAIIIDGQPIGLIGELHPGLMQSLDLTYAPILFELDYECISSVPSARFDAISPYPQIRRDISFTVPEAETFSRIAERASVAASTQLKELRVFDVYQGKGVESGRKSVALGLILQDLSRTLTDEDADRIVAAVVAELQSGLNAKLRE